MNASTPNAGMPAARLSESVYRRRRCKTDWAGIGLANAFRPNAELFVRLAAQRSFYRLLRKVQRHAAAVCEDRPTARTAPVVQPQIGACYTTYPAGLACHAAIGHTAFLECKTRHPAGALHVRLDRLYVTVADQEDKGYSSEAVTMLFGSIIGSVQTRLLLHELSSDPVLASVETYRLFCASQQEFQFRSVIEIVNAMVLYGDVLPDWSRMNLHPDTRSLLCQVVGVCAGYYRRLEYAVPDGLADLGEAWARELCQLAYDSLPNHVPEDSADDFDEEDDEEDDWSNGFPCDRDGDDRSERCPPPPPGLSDLQQRIPPQDAPAPPQLMPHNSLADRLAESFDLPLPGPSGEHVPNVLDDLVNAVSESSQTISRVLEELQGAMHDAAEQNGVVEDMRSDLLEKRMAVQAFEESPIKGNPVEGHLVRLPRVCGNSTLGEVFDRPVELTFNQAAYNRLRSECEPIAQALRQVMYPNIQDLPETVGGVATGSLDPARLAVAGFCEAAYRRHRIHRCADRRGEPVVLIACDASGSLTCEQMRMTKLLAAAWLASTARTNVQLLAGLYHSGIVRDATELPLVQWIYHPHKTPAVGRGDAIHAVASLPDCGSGTQSDALSIAFMLGEAAEIARGRAIYLILISDCAWNCTMYGKTTGEQEVQAAIDEAYERYGNQLHITLVALSSGNATGLDGFVDRTVAVPYTAMANPAAVATQIGTYVASCIRERRAGVMAGRRETTKRRKRDERVPEDN